MSDGDLFWLVVLLAYALYLGWCRWLRYRALVRGVSREDVLDL